MNRTVKTIAATTLIAAAAISLEGVGAPSAEAVASTQTVGDATHFDAKPFCIDVCPEPTPKLAGSGVFVAR